MPQLAALARTFLDADGAVRDELMLHRVAGRMLVAQREHPDVALGL